jgi:hypothetical protein
MTPEQLKNKVREYWNTTPCGTEFINQQKFSPAYFCAIDKNTKRQKPVANQGHAGKRLSQI